MIRRIAMDNYTITSKKTHRFRGDGYTYIVTIIVDKVENIPEPKDDWEAGSMCIIANSHDYRWLNRERKWV